MKKILAIVGARPQFIKHAPIEIAARNSFQMVCVHTGQHYDYKMSQVFFEELKMIPPDYNLMAGSGGHGVQTGKMMIALEPIVRKELPDFVLVYGDTNSTLAGALVASKLNIPVVHVEAGLRSFNRSMPEEINRVLTDHISSLLFVPTEDGVANLKNEGITSGVFLTGDVMYDMIKIAQKRLALTKPESNEEPFCLVTIHRPYNTDNADRLHALLSALAKLHLRVKFAIHPRTLAKMNELDHDRSYDNIEFLEPLSYFDCIRSICDSQMVITDSGGIQKEAYMLKKKCITIRSETEWMETLNNGWNTLVFEDLNEIVRIASEPVGEYREGLYGSGNTAEEIINVLKRMD